MRSVPTYTDDPGKHVAVLSLSASGLEFIVSHLPHEDEITKELVELRERAKTQLWEDTALS